MYLVAILLGVMIPIMDYFNLHLMQNSGYKSKKYLSVLYNRFFSRTTISILANLLFMVILGLIQYLFTIYDIAVNYINYFAIAYLIFLLIDHIILSENCKLPLKYTKRIIRLIIAWILVNTIVVSLLCYVLNCNHFVIVYPFIAIIILLKPFMLVIANWCLYPIEKHIFNNYIKKAKQKLNSIDIIKIGITGSYGKTSVKFILSDILSIKYKVLPTPHSYNTPMGICLAINELRDQEIFIAEMGARNVGDIKELVNIVEPDIGIITGISPQHLETFKTIDNIVDTKYELAEGAKIVIFNGYNNYTKKMYDICQKEKYITGNDITAKNVHYEGCCLKFDLLIKDKSYEVKTRLIGEQNVENILLAVKCAKILKMTDEEIIRGIEKIKQIPNRLECIKSGEKLIIDDSYNSNVVGSKYAINTAKKMGKKVLVVTPGMVELGDIQYNENYLFAKHIGKQCSYLIIVNKINQKALYQGAIDGGMDKENVFFADNLEKAKEIIKQISCDVVLFENDLTDDYK